MSTLREFLLDRIAEEEALAQRAIDAHETGYRWEIADPDEGPHFMHWNPWRVLSGCVAKRLIVAAHRDVGPGLDRRADPDRALKPHACSTCGQYDEYAIEWPCYTLRVLALDWVEHPAYRIEWRPQRLSSGVGRAPGKSQPPSPDIAAATPRTVSVPQAVKPEAAPARQQAPEQRPEQRPEQTPGQPAA